MHKRKWIVIDIFSFYPQTNKNALPWIVNENILHFSVLQVTLEFRAVSLRQ